MLTKVKIIIKQEGGFIGKTDKGYVAILGEQTAGEGDTITVWLPDDHCYSSSAADLQNAFCQAIQTIARLGVFPFTTESTEDAMETEIDD